jgi:hypothetical protein
MGRPDLAPLRRANELLQHGSCVNETIDELRRDFRLDFVDAMAAVAACVALAQSGFRVPEEPFARPYV